MGRVGFPVISAVSFLAPERCGLVSVYDTGAAVRISPLNPILAACVPLQYLVLVMIINGRVLFKVVICDPPTRYCK